MFDSHQYKFITLILIVFSIKVHAQSIVTYAGDSKAERFYSVLELSDGTYVVSGAAKDLNWITGSPSITQIGARTIDNTGVQAQDMNVPFLLHISNDLQNILDVVSLPSGAAIDFKHIKLSSTPGATTGNMFVSGTTANGYFIGKLNNNFVNGTPTAFNWTWNVEASGDHRTRQPWDVGGDGKVVYAEGTPNGDDFAAVFRLKADGSGRDIVENWRYHVGKDAVDGTATEGAWTPANSNGDVITEYSGVLFKSDTRGSLRSWTAAEYNASIADGNGGTKQGQWPMDLFYASAFNIDRPQTTMAMGGYTGYKKGERDTHRIGSIAVDKTTNHIYIGASINSVTSSGQTDSEPFVIAYSQNGSKKWWSRLYTETAGQSVLNQLVDGMAIDYATSSVVVIGRQKGSAADGFWNGNSVHGNVLQPTGTDSFHSAFTGSNNTNVSWIGKLRLSNGNLLFSAYIAGYNGGGTLGAAYAEEDLDGWPNHNDGNADLSTTTVNNNVYVDGAGQVYILATSRAFVTTATAYQKHQKPANGSSVSAANVRVYTANLQSLVYTSALTGVNPASGTGGGNTSLDGAFPVTNGVIVSGRHFAGTNGQAIGSSIPTSNVPPWGKNSPAGESAILAKLTFSEIEAIFNIDPALGNCVNETTVITDSSYTVGGEINSWTWDFGDDANPATADTEGPHEVTWSSDGEKTISLIVTNTLGDSDTTEMTYQVFPAPSAEITTSPGNGSLDPAPITVELSPTEGVNNDYSYEWEIEDLTNGTVTYSTAEPEHELLVAGDYVVRLTVTNGTCSATDSVVLTVTGGPGPIDAEFEVDKEGVCLFQDVVFTQVSDSNVVSWDWAFGEGATPATASTKGPHEVVYTTPGTKTSRLTVSNGVIEETYTYEFEVTEAPLASFTSTGATDAIPATIQFTPDDNAASYAWNFGNPYDSAGNVSTEQNPSYTYEAAGNYMVSLTVTNDGGCSTTFYDSLTIEGGIDTVFADFTIIPSTQTCVNNTVTITDMSRGYESNERQWYFDDPDVVIEGDTSNQGSPWSTPGPVNVYWTTPGEKTVTLKVIGSSGNDDTKVASQTFMVYPYPNANFDVETEDCNSLSVLFTANQANGNYYEWDFGDGSDPVNASVIQHTYASAGQYTVTLTVVNNGCESVVSKTVNIGDCDSPLYTAGIIVSAAREDCASQRYYFEDASQGTFTSWEWDFGNGSQPATASGPGPHEVIIDSENQDPVTVTLTVTDEDGNTYVVTTEIEP
ncbi:MAG: hypothetical protein CMO01_07055 [Thalassobius sp.]|nr:hypothetical protein [Thalassovita sp.]